MKDSVVVVGGGPAGASAAIGLAREGFAVRLLDRARFPRPKPCGEFVNPGACALLAELGQEPFAWPEAAQIDALTMGVAEVPLPVPGVSVPRETLDARLVDAARAQGVEVMEGFSVRQPLVEDGRVVGVAGEGFAFRASAVVAADGTHSALARAMGLVRAVPRLARVGWRARLRVPDAGAQTVRMSPAGGTFPGVFGMSVHPDGMAVASGVLPRCEAWRLNRDKASFVRAVVGEVEVLEVATVPCFGHTARPWCEGMVLAGDAARFVDPFTGEGIHHALEGGLLAARAVTAHLRRERPLSDLVALRSELDARYRLCDWVQRAVHTPRLADWACRWMAARPRAATRLIAALVDARPASYALSPRLLLESVRA